MYNSPPPTPFLTVGTELVCASVTMVGNRQSKLRYISRSEEGETRLQLQVLFVLPHPTPSSRCMSLYAQLLSRQGAGGWLKHG